MTERRPPFTAGAGFWAPWQRNCATAALASDSSPQFQQVSLLNELVHAGWHHKPTARVCQAALQLAAGTCTFELFVLHPGTLAH